MDNHYAFKVDTTNTCQKRKLEHDSREEVTNCFYFKNQLVSNLF